MLSASPCWVWDCAVHWFLYSCYKPIYVWCWREAGCTPVGAVPSCSWKSALLRLGFAAVFPTAWELSQPPVDAGYVEGLQRVVGGLPSAPPGERAAVRSTQGCSVGAAPGPGRGRAARDGLRQSGAGGGRAAPGGGRGSGGCRWVPAEPRHRAGPRHPAGPGRGAGGSRGRRAETGSDGTARLRAASASGSVNHASRSGIEQRFLRSYQLLAPEYPLSFAGSGTERLGAAGGAQNDPHTPRPPRALGLWHGAAAAAVPRTRAAPQVSPGSAHLWMCTASCPAEALAVSMACGCLPCSLKLFSLKVWARAVWCSEKWMTVVLHGYFQSFLH